MPRYPVVSGAAAISALKRLGFVEVRTRGSHVILQRGSATTVVPLKKTLKRGTLGHIIKLAEITLEEFIAAL